MTNFEKHKDEIFEMIKTTNRLAVSKTGKIVGCLYTHCEDCILNADGRPCSVNWKDWINSNYIEPKKFTDAEKELIRTCENIKYAARDENGILYFYTKKPFYNRFGSCWIGDGCISAEIITNEPFKAIKINDREPTSREEILNRGTV